MVHIVIWFCSINIKMTLASFCQDHIVHVKTTLDWSTTVHFLCTTCGLNKKLKKRKSKISYTCTFNVRGGIPLLGYCILIPIGIFLSATEKNWLLAINQEIISIGCFNMKSGWQTLTMYKCWPACWVSLQQRALNFRNRTLRPCAGWVVSCFGAI